MKTKFMKKFTAAMLPFAMLFAMMAIVAPASAIDFMEESGEAEEMVLLERNVYIDEDGWLITEEIYTDEPEFNFFSLFSAMQYQTYYLKTTASNQTHSFTLRCQGNFSWDGTYVSVGGIAGSHTPTSVTGYRIFDVATTSGTSPTDSTAFVQHSFKTVTQNGTGEKTLSIRLSVTRTGVATSGATTSYN